MRADSPIVPLLAGGLIAVIAVFWAVTNNDSQDLFIYRAGAEIGLRGESPYDVPRIRSLVAVQYPTENPDRGAFVNNCGYFLPPMAVFLYAPFTLLPWPAAKVAWAVLAGLAAAAVASVTSLFRRPTDPSPGLLGLVASFGLVFNLLVLLSVAKVAQVTVLAVGCVVIGQRCYDRGRPLLGTLLWAVPFIKPHLALPLLPLAWYLGGWRRVAGILAVVAVLNLLGATLVGGSPLFLRDYLAYLPTGHKEVLYNRAEENLHITSWNRLLYALTEHSAGNRYLIELTAVTTLAGYLVWFGLVVGRCGLAGTRPPAAWAMAAAGAGAVVCSQVLAYELVYLALAVPWVRDLFNGGWRLRGWAAVLLLLIHTVPIPADALVAAFYRPAGTLLFALLVLLGPPNPYHAEEPPAG